MSRDRRAAPDSPDSQGPGAATDPARDGELLTAYVDGVAELSPDERHRAAALLARDPQARADQAAVRSLLDQLRRLGPLHEPDGASEPDWAALARSIHQAVGRDVPRPWWRTWRWLAPATMLATAATVLLVTWARPARVLPQDPQDPQVAVARGLPAPTPRPAEEIVPLWLDGTEVDVDVSAADTLGDAGLGTSGDDDPEQPGSDPDEVALLPTTDLAWIDKLDDAAIDRAERWLARKKG